MITLIQIIISQGWKTSYPFLNSMNLEKQAINATAVFVRSTLPINYMTFFPCAAHQATPLVSFFSCQVGGAHKTSQKTHSILQLTDSKDAHFIFLIIHYQHRLLITLYY